MEIPSLKQLIDIKNNTIIEKVAEIKKVLYFIHPMETKKPLKSQPSKYGKNVNWVTLSL